MERKKTGYDTSHLFTMSCIGEPMKLAIYPGSFDPVTNGHLNVIERASKLVDHLIVAVLDNPNKQSMFTMGERVHMLKKVTETLSNVEIDSSHKLLYEYAQEKNCKFLVRGIRFYAEFESEFQRALLLRKIAPQLETIFLTTESEYSYLSSSIVKEIAFFGGDIKQMVPSYVETMIQGKIKIHKSEV